MKLESCSCEEEFLQNMKLPLATAATVGNIRRVFNVGKHTLYFWFFILLCTFVEPFVALLATNFHDDAKDDTLLWFQQRVKVNTIVAVTCS